VCDHADDAAVARVFDQIRAEAGRLDVLVNNAASPG
jgi:NAD(P)-dependent dehydrogenase (short-subunit alcohol dehydrogenase family)